MADRTEPLAEHPGGLRVAVILGGQSAERDVSVHTGRTVALELSKRYRVQPVLILPDGSWSVSGRALGEGLPGDPERWFEGEGVPVLEGLGRLRARGVDVAFNALHGPMGEDGTVQGLFRMVGIPLTGPDVIPAAVTMDKRFTKQVLQAAGVPTPRFFTLPARSLLEGASPGRKLLEENAAHVPLPWILKPNRLGSSVGVAVFQSLDQVLREAADLVRGWPPLALDDQLLVEQVIQGRELTCGVIEAPAPAEALPPIEIRPRSSRFFDYHAKYVPGASEEICPAPLSAGETLRVQETALEVHRLLECAPLSRTDMFLTPEGHLEVLEVNTLPGMTATSLIPLSAGKAGVPLEELLSRIVEHALARAGQPRLPRGARSATDGTDG